MSCIIMHAAVYRDEPLQGGTGQGLSQALLSAIQCRWVRRRKIVLGVLPILSCSLKCLSFHHCIATCICVMQSCCASSTSGPCAHPQRPWSSCPGQQHHYHHHHYQHHYLSIHINSSSSRTLTPNLSIQPTCRMMSCRVG